MVECFGPLLILAGLLLAFYALVLRPTVVGDRWHGPLRQIAQKYRGVYESGGWFGLPKVRFYDAQGGVAIEVRNSSHSRPVCCITAELPGIAITGQIGPGDSHGSPFHSGSAEQLGEFILYTDQREQGQMLMTDGVRWVLTQLQHTPERTGIQVEFMPYRVQVRKPWYSSKQADWDRYLGLVLGLRDQLLLAGAAAIEFAPGAGEVDLHGAKCPFCGEPVEDQPVLCRACRTPHHRECWEANGSCSMYGCKESLFLLPAPGRWKSAPRPNKPR